jgi:sugar/nucleoside kinase (ribokinase family)
MNKNKDVDLVVVGSVALDTIETPETRRKEVLGGSATFACAAASFFAKAGMVGVVGTDFPKQEHKRLRKYGIDLNGLQCVAGKTFRWSGVYEADFVNRRTLDTQLGVFADFKPLLPKAYRKAPYLMLGNIGPDLQMNVLEQAQGARFVAMDTMDLWLDIARAALMGVIKRVDMLMLNDAEARKLTGKFHLRDCAEAILKMGPKYVVIKKGEHGALFFSSKGIVIIPAYPIRKVVDPTGAGDAYAGAMMGYLAAHGSVKNKTIVDALRYASVVASFGVEAFGLDTLDGLTHDKIEKRRKELAKMSR